MTASTYVKLAMVPLLWGGRFTKRFHENPKYARIAFMIHVAFAFNFNIQRCEIEVGEEEVIVRKGYLPLIDKLLAHGLKADLFLSGFSTRRILEIDRHLIETIKEHLGNTKIETFTQGKAKPIWELTMKVRERLLKAERDNPDSQPVKKAWEHLLLSHNSDGRIGYWYSEWNPGEHKVAPSRRKFIEDNLKKVLQELIPE